MAEATVAPVKAAAGELRIVLFGLRSAGKSSLLGALAQAAQTQEKYLKGQVIDRSEGRLAALHQRLFEDAPEQTQEDIVLYPLQFIPLTPSGPGPARNVVIYDCNGQSASDILLSQQLDGRARRSSLVRALVDSDTIVLVVDASDKPSQLDRDFAQFVNFLRIFEESRAKHGEVGGLPVYVVLTKCDLLAQKGDTASAWIQRIEERKRLVAQRFQKFLAKQADPSFGKISLNLWATAIHRPALADRPAKSAEPFGVADLFRQSLQSAMAYNAVRQQTHRRMQYTLLGVAALVAVMLTLALAFYFGRPPEGLEQLGRAIEMNTPASNLDISERVDAKDAARKAAKVKELMQDPKFVDLDKVLKQRASGFVKEVERYKDLKEQYKQVSVSPNVIDHAAVLQEARKRLAEFNVPPEFAATNFGKIKQHLENDLTKLDEAVTKEHTWYEEQKRKGQPLDNINLGELSRDPAKRKEWLAKVDEYLNAEPPYPNNDKRLPDTTVSNQTVYNFETVIRARNDLDAVKQRLLKLRKFVE